MTKPLILLIAIFCCLASVEAGQKKQAPVARPFLIVPGYSIGKVILGMDRATVHRKMGAPISRLENALFYDDNGNREALPSGTGPDTWERKRFNKAANAYQNAGTFTVNFSENKVVSISIYFITGYATAEGLTLFDSPVKQFQNRYGEAMVTESNLDPESPTGISHSMQSVLDFPTHGLKLTTDTYPGDSHPKAVLGIVVYSAVKN